jgi:hypothetical protein
MPKKSRVFLEARSDIEFPTAQTTKQFKKQPARLKSEIPSKMKAQVQPHEVPFSL